MKHLLLIFFAVLAVNASGQLHCKTNNEADGGQVKTCFHSNGKSSTVETWDANRTWGNLLAYTSEGIELFNYGLRKVAGHSSVDLDYHSNGQVSKAHFSDAPDGGIQFHKSTCWYDEQGAKTNCRDEGYPLLSPSTDPTFQPLEISPPPAFIQEVMTCGAPCMSVYRIVNTTRKKVNVTLKALPNGMIQRSNKLLLLLPAQTLSVDSILMSDLYFEPLTVYRPEVISASRKPSKLKVISDTPEHIGTRKVFTWYVVRK